MKGNPVMKAKRVTGPTPHQALMTLLGVKQIDGTLPVANGPQGEKVKSKGETGHSIMARVQASIAGRTFLQHREY